MLNYSVAHWKRGKLKMLHVFFHQVWANPKKLDKDLFYLVCLRGKTVPTPFTFTTFVRW
jgi:hypothetical protein